MQHTTNYSLPQWEDTDAIKREDVNGALAAVDAAIAGASLEIQTGSYGGASAPSTRPLVITYKPKMILLFNDGGGNEGNYITAALITPNLTIALHKDGSITTEDDYLTMTQYGFTIDNTKIADIKLGIEVLYSMIYYVILR